MKLHLIYDFNDALEFQWKGYVFESITDAVKMLEADKHQHARLRKFSETCNINTRYFSDDDYKDIKDSGLLGMKFVEMDGNSLQFEIVPPIKDKWCEVKILEFVADTLLLI